MRRRDFTIGLLFATAARTVRAQQQAKQHRIAIVIPAGPVAVISEIGSDSFRRRYYQTFFEQLRRLGDLEGRNLVIERYSGEGRPEGYADLARQVVTRNPDLIVAQTNPVALAVRAVTDTIPVVWIGVDPISEGLVTSLSRPGGNLTGVSLYDFEIYGKRLQILKQAIPSASNIGWLTPRRTWEGDYGRPFQRVFLEAARRLELSIMPLLVQESTPSEYERVFAEIAPAPPDAIMVSDIGDLIPYRQLIVELIEKNRLPAIYGYRDYVEAGGLMAYGAELGELGRRMAEDVHEILTGEKPGDIPIYQATKFYFMINLRAANAIDLPLPPALLARADEIIE